MLLSYRSVSYNHAPPTLEVTEGEIQGKHRGTSWKCYTIAETPIPRSPQASETQKGFYSQQDFSQIERSSQARPICSTFNVLQQLKGIHKANIDRSLEHRMQVAKDRGDYQLLQVLESELRETVLR